MLMALKRTLPAKNAKMGCKFFNHSKSLETSNKKRKKPSKSSRNKRNWSSKCNTR